MAIANVNGVDIYYETQGSGEPVLLVPPSWWPCATWNVVVVSTLSRRYCTIIYDGRGTGRSGKPKDGYTVRQFAADGVELLKQLGVSHCHAVGFAIGGQIVQAMAIERTDLIASLTIAATGPGSRRLDGTPREVGSEALQDIEKIGFENTSARISTTTTWRTIPITTATIAKSPRVWPRRCGRGKARWTFTISTNKHGLAGIL
jgi:pimeloyl-ACP methyl ester carboxylesterase